MLRRPKSTRFSGARPINDGPWLPLEACPDRFQPKVNRTGSRIEAAGITIHEIQMELFPNPFSRRRETGNKHLASVISMPLDNFCRFGKDDPPIIVKNIYQRHYLENVIQFGKYISARKIRVLYFSFSSISAKSCTLDEITLRLHQFGKILVGDVVQMTEQEIVNATGADREVMLELIHLLNGFGLELGRKIPGWSTGLISR